MNGFVATCKREFTEHWRFWPYAFAIGFMAGAGFMAIALTVLATFGRKLFP